MCKGPTVSTPGADEHTRSLTLHFSQCCDPKNSTPGISVTIMLQGQS